MFNLLTFAEWDALCSKLERSLAHEIPKAWPSHSYERYDLTDEIADVHGLLMMRPTLERTP